MARTMQVKGMSEISKEIKKFAKRYPIATANAIYQEGLDIERNATKRAPVEFGRLRASAYTTVPSLNNYVVEVGFGTEYALRQHEETTWKHTHGEAKYLEKAIDEQSVGALERLRRRIDKWVSRGTDSFPTPISNTSPVDIGDKKPSLKKKKKSKAKKAKAKRQTPKRKK